jgi:hypothetical protein
VLNILNTKYIIDADAQTGERYVMVNPDANGAAWFVDNLFFVKGAAAELEALATVDLRREAVVDERFGDIIDISTPGITTDSLAAVNIVEYRPNYLKYETLAATEQVAVFSEMYYDKGWTAYVDGEEAPYFRADYLLRAMVVPAGTHTIEWRFRAPRFAAVEGVTLAASIAILLWLAVAILFDRRKNCRQKNDTQKTDHPKTI